MPEQFIEMMPERGFAGLCVSHKCRIVTPEQERICFVDVESVASESEVTDLMDPWVAVMEKKMRRNRFLLSLPRIVKHCWNRWTRIRASLKFRHAATKAEHWEKHVYIRNRSIPL